MESCNAGQPSFQSLLLLLAVEDAASCLNCTHYFIHRVRERGRGTRIGGYGTVVDEIYSFPGKFLLVKRENVAVNKLSYQGLAETE